MQISLLPKTTFGWWSCGLAVSYVVFYLLSTVIVGDESAYNTLAAVVTTIIGACIATAAAATGIIGVVKNKENSVLVYLSTVIGIYCLVGCIISLTGKTQ